MTALMLCCGLFAAEVSGAGAVDAAEPPIRLVLDPGHHTAPITALVFTPDSRQLVSASQDKTIRVWELASRKTLRVIRGESGLGNFGEIGAMALSPDGRLLATAVRPAAPGKSALIRLYDFAGGAQIGLLAGRDGDVHGLAFSPDGRHLISGGSDGTATIWDTDARKAVHVLKAHRGAVSAVGFSPDGMRAVTASLDHSLRLWRVADGALLRDMAGHSAEVVSMAIAADGTVASQDKTGEIRFWDGRTGTFIKTLTPFPWSGTLAFSPDGRELLVTCNDSAGARRTRNMSSAPPPGGRTPTTRITTGLSRPVPSVPTGIGPRPAMTAISTSRSLGPVRGKRMRMAFRKPSFWVGKAMPSWPQPSRPTAGRLPGAGESMAGLRIWKAPPACRRRTIAARSNSRGRCPRRRTRSLRRSRCQ